MLKKEGSIHARSMKPGMDAAINCEMKIALNVDFTSEFV